MIVAINETGDQHDKEGSPALKIGIVAMYAAACVGAGYMLIFIPNVEVYDMMVFLGGLLFGPGLGTIIAFTAELIHSIFNIYGASPLPLLLVQLLAYPLLGLAGGLLKNTRLRKTITKRSQVVFGMIGLVFAFTYTILADIIWPIFGGLGTSIVLWVLQGMPLRIVLMACDFITFSMLLPLILVAVEKHLAAIFPSQNKLD